MNADFHELRPESIADRFLVAGKGRLAAIELFKGRLRGALWRIIGIGFDDVVEPPAAFDQNLIAGLGNRITDAGG